MSKFFPIAINSKMLNKFMSVGNKHLAKINKADAFTGKFFGGKGGLKTIVPKAPNPAAANKVWPM